jgi:hypothetical protein
MRKDKKIIIKRKHSINTHSLTDPTYMLQGEVPDICCRKIDGSDPISVDLNSNGVFKKKTH